MKLERGARSNWFCFWESTSPYKSRWDLQWVLVKLSGIVTELTRITRHTNIVRKFNNALSPKVCTMNTKIGMDDCHSEHPCDKVDYNRLSKIAKMGRTFKTGAPLLWTCFNSDHVTRWVVWNGKVYKIKDAGSAARSIALLGPLRRLKVVHAYIF